VGVTTPDFPNNPKHFRLSSVTNSRQVAEKRSKGTLERFHKRQHLHMVCSALLLLRRTFEMRDGILGFASAVVIGFGVTPVALAADMPLKAPMMAPAPPSWTGLYIGANGGYGWSKDTVSEAPFGVTGIADILPQSLGLSNKGALFGGQIGYNWQIASWVLGIEGDYDAASITSTQAVVFPSIIGGPGTTHSDSFTATDNITGLASVRGRLGYTWGPALLYFTGGGAWESVTSNATISANTAPGVFGQSATGSFSSTRSGYVVGGGLEWMATPNWIVRAEYLHYDFNGGVSNSIGIANCAVPGCGVTATSANNNIDVFRLATSYKFDWLR
jgi:outer membrane immunogenic protein